MNYCTFHISKYLDIFERQRYKIDFRFGKDFSHNFKIYIFAF